MSMTPRRLAAGLLAAAALAGGAAPSTLAATHTQRLEVGAQLLRQPKGAPWEINLVLGAQMGMDDNSTPPPVNHMVFSFTKGAKVHGDAFKTCTAQTLERKGPGTCPAKSVLGKGTAEAWALSNLFHADLTVYNGPGTNKQRKIVVFAKLKEIPTLTVILDGTLRQTSGKYGFVLDLPMPTIAPIGAGSEASITKFEATVGGYGTLKGKRVPFVEAPTSCSGSGWPFQGQFSYADGTKATVNSHIGCTIRSTPDAG